MKWWSLRQLVRVRYGHKPTVSGFNSLTVTKTRRTPTAIVAYAMIVFLSAAYLRRPHAAKRTSCDACRLLQALPPA